MTRAALRVMPAVIGLAMLAGAGGPGRPAAAPSPSVIDAAPAPRRDVVVEHRYRIVGKVRLALIWMARDDVGAARMTFRSDGTTSSLALLVGSNPDRAPHNLNEWSYLREEVGPDRTDVFTLRSLGSEDVPAQAALPAAGSSFGVSCVSIDERQIASAKTTVSADATYWMFDRVLEQVAASRQWQAQQMPRPAGAAPGFLSALQHALRLGRRGAAAATPPIAYVYNNALYELSARDSEALGATRIGSRSFARLVRTDFSVHNRATGDVTRFRVTYTPDDDSTPLPVQILYRPSFWLRVELRLDDSVSVPADPAEDDAVRSRIRAICASTANRSQ
jgi:hypothetical protein